MMKKTIIASMVLAVGLIASPVMASEQSTIDYDSMSTEELVALRDEINAQIADRGGDNVLPQGTYEVGKDIKAGQYKVSGCKGYDLSCFNVYSSKEDHDVKGDAVQGSVSYEEGDSEMMNIDDGEYLDVTWGSLVVEEISASWMVEN